MHPATFSGLNNLGLILKLTGNFIEAEKIYTKVL